jgi:membrane fusion protein (multidrug efflux system)
VSQIDPIWAYFNISESLYLNFAPQISKALQRSVVRSDLPVEYIQANDTFYPFKGNIIFVNREIAAGTGTIQLAAAFPNQGAILRPGGFGRVRVRTGTSRNALLVPQAAIIEVQSQYQLIVVSSDNKATIRPVKTGDRVGANWIVTDGLKAGERVVVEGIQRVQTFAAQAPELAKEGIPVTPKPHTAAAGGSN